MKKIDLQKRIDFLEKMIRKYYKYNYKAKQRIGLNVGVYCCLGEDADLEGNEEYLTEIDNEMLKQIIKDLPLWVGNEE